VSPPHNHRTEEIIDSTDNDCSEGQQHNRGDRAADDEQIGRSGEPDDRRTDDERNHRRNERRHDPEDDVPKAENEERNAEQDRLCPGDDDRSNQRVVQQQIRFFE